jgi:hypothetical protein
MHLEYALAREKEANLSRIGGIRIILCIVPALTVIKIEKQE